MTTLIMANPSTGYSRCDAKCHEAKDSKCHCICGGVFHGARAAGGQGELDRRVNERGYALIQVLGWQGKDVESRMQGVLQPE